MPRPMEGPAWRVCPTTTTSLPFERTKTPAEHPQRPLVACVTSKSWTASKTMTKSGPSTPLPRNQNTSLSRSLAT
ncbi:hypothetical protein B0H12DRAFT_679924 [Mycena haematopus]|nr:hypothetical protein B0H12DRAFT_679924 [Mycena haematopus]